MSNRPRKENNKGIVYVFVPTCIMHNEAPTYLQTLLFLFGVSW